MKKIILIISHLALFFIIQYLPDSFCLKSPNDFTIKYGFPNNVYLFKESYDNYCGLVETDFNIINLILNILIYILAVYIILFLIKKIKTYHPL